MVPREFAAKMLGVSMGRFARIVLRATLENNMANNNIQQPPKPNPGLRSSDKLVDARNISGPDIRGQVTLRISLST